MPTIQAGDGTASIVSFARARDEFENVSTLCSQNSVAEIQ